MLICQSKMTKYWLYYIEEKICMKLKFFIWHCYLFSIISYGSALGICKKTKSRFGELLSHRGDLLFRHDDLLSRRGYLVTISPRRLTISNRRIAISPRRVNLIRFCITRLVQVLVTLKLYYWIFMAWSITHLRGIGC